MTGMRPTKDGRPVPIVWTLMAHHQQLETYIWPSWEAQGMMVAGKGVVVWTSLCMYRYGRTLIL